MALHHEIPRLIPRVFADALFPLVLQILDPPVQPGRGRRIPGEGGRGEEQTPVFDSGVQGEDFLPGLPRKEEGLLVHTFEEGGGLSEGAPEAGGLCLLFGERFGPDVRLVDSEEYLVEDSRDRGSTVYTYR